MPHPDTPSTRALAGPPVHASVALSGEHGERAAGMDRCGLGALELLAVSCVYLILSGASMASSASMFRICWHRMKVWRQVPGRARLTSATTDECSSGSNAAAILLLLLGDEVSSCGSWGLDSVLAFEPTLP